MMSDLFANGWDQSSVKVDYLMDTNAYDISYALEYTDYTNDSRLFSSMPEDAKLALQSNAFTMNWHHYGVSPETFDSFLAPAGLRALSTNHDKDGLPFVSTFEHESHQIWATQWHPEANAFDRQHQGCDHSQEAIKNISYFAEFFVGQARDEMIRRSSQGEWRPFLHKTIESFPTMHIEHEIGFNYVFD